MKRKALFIVTNILLVLVIGLIIGFTIIAKETSFNGRVLGFILLLITLCAPTFIFLAGQPMNSPINVGTLLFVVGNAIANVCFMIFVPELNVLAITEAIIIGVYLIYMMIVIALLGKEKKAQ